MPPVNILLTTSFDSPLREGHFDTAANAAAAASVAIIVACLAASKSIYAPPHGPRCALVVYSLDESGCFGLLLLVSTSFIQRCYK